MTDQQINEAIARHCGWTDIGHIMTNDGQYYMGGRNPAKTHAQMPIPDYANDLNAMYLVEKEAVLPHHWDGYERELRMVHLAREGLPRHTWHYSASVRAEAFIKTVGGWQ